MKYYDVSPHPKCSIENQTLQYHENNEKQSSNQNHFTAGAISNRRRTIGAGPYTDNLIRSSQEELTWPKPDTGPE